MAKSQRLLGLALGVFALVALTVFMADRITTTSATGGGPEMALVVKSGGTCDGDTCSVEPGADFTLSTEIIAGPDGGYIGAQSFIVFGPDLVYNPTTAAADEFTWTDCETAVGLRDQITAEDVLHGCLTGLVQLPLSTYTGNLVDLAFTCSAEPSSTVVELVPIGEEPAGNSGAGFATSPTVSVPAKVSDLTINCGEVGGETPTDAPTGTPTGPTATTGPTNTPAPVTDTPTATPAPPTPTPSAQPCGDVDGDGEVTSLDALQTLWLVAGLVSSTEKSADINGDGTVTSIDAALILQVVAALYECE